MEALEAIEMPVKRTYQKHKIEGVISVIHFPNNKIKPTVIDGINHYPLYLRITVKKQVTTIKSLLKGVFTEKSLSSFGKGTYNFKSMEIEKTMIVDFIKELNPFYNDDFHISKVSNFHSNIYKSIDFINVELTTSWVGDFLEEYAEENDVDKKLFMSVINLNRDTVYTVIRAFKHSVIMLAMLYEHNNHLLMLILGAILRDKILYNEIISCGEINEETFIKLNKHFFEDLKIPNFICK